MIHTEAEDIAMGLKFFLMLMLGYENIFFILVGL